MLKICKVWSRDNKKLTCVSYPSIPFFAQNFFITLGYMLIAKSYFSAEKVIHRLSTGTLCADGSHSVKTQSINSILQARAAPTRQCENSTYSQVIHRQAPTYPQVIHRRRRFHRPTLPPYYSRFFPVCQIYFCEFLHIFLDFSETLTGQGFQAVIFYGADYQSNARTFFFARFAQPENSL